MAKAFTPRDGVNLKRIKPASLRAWLDTGGEGRRSDGFELRFKGRELAWARQIVVFLALDPETVTKAKLGEPIEYRASSKDRRG